MATTQSSLSYGAKFRKNMSRMFKRTRNELPEVSLDDVLQEKTCSPISLQDFKWFLKNREHTLENLDFYYWYLDYRERFRSLSDLEKAKSPMPREKARPVASHTVTMDSAIGFGNDNDERTAEELSSQNIDQTDSSFKELNIEQSLKKYVKYHACRTTHPEVFAEVFEHINWVLGHSSLPNFLHNAILNIRSGWVAVYYVSAFIHLIHVPLILYMTYSMHMPRLFRLPILFFAFGGIGSFFTARIGFCSFRGLFKRRQTPLYELDDIQAARMSTEKYTRTTGAQNVTHLTTILDPNVRKHNIVSVFVIT
ncbi:hypothetical protein NQZ79_g8817 [Umbelopsis isabellina]|nr:hypothetical protein NQZ79_g8817 [Umbelopsis isabellina]